MRNERNNCRTSSRFFSISRQNRNENEKKTSSQTNQLGPKYIRKRRYALGNRRSGIKVVYESGGEGRRGKQMHLSKTNTFLFKKKTKNYNDNIILCRVRRRRGNPFERLNTSVFSISRVYKFRFGDGGDDDNPPVVHKQIYEIFISSRSVPG